MIMISRPKTHTTNGLLINYVDYNYAIYLSSHSSSFPRVGGGAG